MNSFVVLNLTFLCAILIGLIGLHKKQKSLSTRVFTALFLGVLSGLALQYCYPHTSDIITTTINYLDVIGIGYVKLLQMIIMPLIVVSIISAIINVEGKHTLKHISFFSISVLLGTTAIAAAIGIFVTNLFHLTAECLPHGQMETLRAARIDTLMQDLSHDTFATMILNFIPENIFFDLTGARSTSTIAVVIISSLIGLSAIKVQDENAELAEPFIKFLKSIHAIVMQLVKTILALTPYGIFALMTKVMAKSELSVILSLMQFIAASYAAIGLMFVVHLMLISFSGISPVYYLKKAFTALSFAFTSRSSAGTIPLNVQTQTQAFKVPESIANFSASFGATIGQNGCAGIYPAMLAVMVAPTVGIDPTSGQFIMMLLLVTTISSLGVAGVGGGATFAALIVLSSMNLPVAIVALLISIEPLIDMARTMLNVNGSMTAGIVTHRLLRDKVVDEDEALSIEEAKTETS